MLGQQLAPLVVANRTPSPSILEGGSDDNWLIGPLAERRARSWDADVDGGRGDEGAQSAFDVKEGPFLGRTNDEYLRKAPVGAVVVLDLVV